MMTSTDLLSIVGGIGTIAGLLMYVLWARHADDTNFVWLRFIGSLILGSIFGYFLGCIFATKDTTTIYVAVGLGYFLSFCLVCLGFFSSLFALLPKNVQEVMKLCFLSVLAVFVFAAVFGKTIAWLLRVALILLIIWTIRNIAYRFIPKSIQKIIDAIIAIGFAILLIKIIFNNLIKSVIVIAIVVVLALKVE